MKHTFKNWIVIVLAIIFLVLVFPKVFRTRSQYEEIEDFCAFGVIGDCKTTTTNTVEDITTNLTQIDNSIKQSIDQSCSSTGSASNVMNIINSKLNSASINQKNVLKNVCSLQSSFSSNVSAEAQNKVAATIAQHAKSTGTLIGGAPADSNNIQRSITDNKTFIDNSQVLNSVKRCVMNISAENIANIIGSDVSNSNFNQANDSFMQCLANDNVTANIAAEGKTAKDTQTNQDAAAEGGDFLKSISGIFSQNTTSMVTSIIAFVLCSSIIAIALIMLAQSPVAKEAVQKM
jgi:hypothetical protein